VHHDVDSIAQVLMDLGYRIPILPLLLLNPAIPHVGLWAEVWGDTVGREPACEVKGGLGGPGIERERQHLEEVLVVPHKTGAEVILGGPVLYLDHPLRANRGLRGLDVASEKGMLRHGLEMARLTIHHLELLVNHNRRLETKKDKREGVMVMVGVYSSSHELTMGSNPMALCFFLLPSSRHALIITSGSQLIRPLTPLTITGWRACHLSINTPRYLTQGKESQRR
jgi:hypothetical protein